MKTTQFIRTMLNTHIDEFLYKNGRPIEAIILTAATKRQLEAELQTINLAFFDSLPVFVDTYNGVKFQR